MYITTITIVNVVIVVTVVFRIGSFKAGTEKRRGVVMTTHPHLSAEIMKE